MDSSKSAVQEQNSKSAASIIDRALRLEASGRSDAGSKILLAAFLLQQVPDPQHSTEWLRRRLQIDRVDEGIIFDRLDLPLGGDRLNVQESAEFDAVLDWARAFAKKTDGKVRARTLLGGLLFATPRDTRTLMAQDVLGRITNLPTLRSDFLNWAANATENRPAEREGWKAILEGRTKIGASDMPRDVVAGSRSLQGEDIEQNAYGEAVDVRTRPSVRAVAAGDRRSSEDHLGLTPYVDGLAAFLLDEDTEPPLTLSIEGEWGTGKSTFLGLLKTQIERSGKRVIEFNPWRYDKDESLWAGFAERFYECVKAPWWRPRGYFRLAWERFDKQKAILPLVKFVAYCAVVIGVGYWIYKAAGNVSAPPSGWVKHAITIGGAVATLIAAAKASSLATAADTFLGNPFKMISGFRLETVDYESKRSFLFRFQDDFERVVEAFVPEDRIFVFIDDLDRCEPARAADLLQALTVMLPEKSKIVALLAIDRERVASAVAMRSEKVLPLIAPAAPDSAGKLPYDPVAAREQGDAFLEKLIQLPLRLPRPGESQIKSYIDKLLRAPKAEAASDQRQNAFPSFSSSGANEVSALSEVPVDVRDDAVPGGPSNQGPRAQFTHVRSQAQRAVARDSHEIREALEMAAPALGGNPRRLVQFLNSYRLQVYLAEKTGLFDPEPSQMRPPVTMIQLAKLTVIGLRWPRVALRMAENPEIIEEYDMAAVLGREPPQPAPRDWPRFRALLTAHVRVPLWTNVAEMKEAVIRAALAHDPGHLTGVDAATVFSTWAAPDAERARQERADGTRSVQSS
jgi:hypothetical protein